MVDFSHRSSEIEIMDTFSGTPNELSAILKDINRVNSLLGGYRITLNAVFKLLTLKKQKSYTILDMGCAEGSMLRKLAEEARKRSVKVQLIGLDFNSKALALGEGYAAEYPEIRYMQADILSADFSDIPIDVVMTTLTLHHFDDKGVLKFVKKFNELASLGVVINDLERSPLAYYLFQAFSFFFVKTEIAKNDGLLSIRRAFKKKELRRYADHVKSATHHIQWKWAFRYVWVLKKK
ncbi:MAG: methyltransferase domain-containing protein [Ekhidna sp.]